MSELTTIARPYAKAAFEFAVEHKAVDQWLEMLDFAAQVAENETMHSLVNGSVAAEELAKLFVGVCGEQLNEHGQNLIRVMAENGRAESQYSGFSGTTSRAQSEAELQHRCVLDGRGAHQGR